MHKEELFGQTWHHYSGLPQKKGCTFVLQYTEVLLLCPLNMLTCNPLPVQL